MPAQAEAGVSLSTLNGGGRRRTRLGLSAGTRAGGVITRFMRVIQGCANRPSLPWRGSQGLPANCTHPSWTPDPSPGRRGWWVLGEASEDRAGPWGGVEPDPEPGETRQYGACGTLRRRVSLRSTRPTLAERLTSLH